LTKTWTINFELNDPNRDSKFKPMLVDPKRPPARCFDSYLLPPILNSRHGVDAMLCPPRERTHGPASLGTAKFPFCVLAFDLKMSIESKTMDAKKIVVLKS
jgi:hypothetical protein